MPLFRAKQTEVTAVQHPGPSKLVVVGRKGEQTASVGDFIVFNGDRPEDREVISNKDFFEKYEPVDGIVFDPAGKPIEVVAPIDEPATEPSAEETVATGEGESVQ